MRRAARSEEAGQHDQATGQEAPVAGHVEFGKGHIWRADLQRHHVVAESADRQRHHAEKHHDGAVHGTELIVEVRCDDAVHHVGLGKPATDHRQGLAWISDRPTHHHHQAEAEEEEAQRSHAVLNPDPLMVDRENVFPEPPFLVMALFLMMLFVVLGLVAGHVISDQCTHPRLLRRHRSSRGELTLSTLAELLPKSVATRLQWPSVGHPAAEGKGEASQGRREPVRGIRRSGPTKPLANRRPPSNHRARGRVLGWS